MFLLGEGFKEDGLCQRLQSASGEALEDAADDELFEARGSSAEKGSHGKSGDTEEQHAAASEVLASQPDIGRIMAFATR